MDWEYNGVYANINLDGELGLFRKGATDNKGVTTNAQPQISTLQMTKDGKIILGYTDFDQNDPSSAGIVTDSPNILLDQLANKITVNGKNDFELNASTSTQINTPSFKINSGSEALLNATTYRTSEIQLHTQLEAALTAMLALVSAAGGGLTVAGNDPAFIGVAPVAAPAVLSAGVALTAVGPIITQMITAIQTFEAEAAQYLSKQNFQSDT